MALGSGYMSRVLLVFLSSMLLMSSTALTAEGYQPDEFLGLDLSRAALSPKLLGPANTFGAVPTKAGGHRGVAEPHARAKAADPARAEHVSAPKRVRTVHIHIQKPRGAARTRLAHRPRNPLDAQARDTRIQVWPCKSGGICKWKQ